MSGAMRLKSIGTLTGWQMLAEQVGHADMTTSSDGSRFSSSTNTGGAPGGGAKRRSEDGSGDEDLTVRPSGGSFVNPRPHQWLYKEYKLLEEIGSGGFGRVVKARRLADGHMVVVKEVKTTPLDAKQKAATMAEVEVLAKLDHPNIVHYHDCFMDEVYINIVMEYCDSGDLTGVIKGRKGALMSEDQIMDYFVQVCVALHHVHSRGILHRDLKPSNVLVTSAGLLKMGDFGVSKINSTDGSSMACTVVGTPHYLSPEMCDNKPYGRKSDVWALGCLLVELCTLSKAFEGSSISKIVLSIMRGAYKQLPDSYSQGLRDLVASLMHVSPADRPSVHELLQTPYVQHHLQRYLGWACRVPDARRDIIVACLHNSGALLRGPAPRAAPRLSDPGGAGAAAGGAAPPGHARWPSGGSSGGGHHDAPWDGPVGPRGGPAGGGGGAAGASAPLQWPDMGGGGGGGRPHNHHHHHRSHKHHNQQQQQQQHAQQGRGEGAWSSSMSDSAVNQAPPMHVAPPAATLSATAAQMTAVAALPPPPPRPYIEVGADGLPLVSLGDAVYGGMAEEQAEGMRRLRGLRNKLRMSLDGAAGRFAGGGAAAGAGAGSGGRARRVSNSIYIPLSEPEAAGATGA